MHGLEKVRVGPGSDTRLRIRRDVGRVDRSKLGLERQAAGKRLAPICGVAGLAVSCLGQVLGPRERIGLCKVRRYAGRGARVFGEHDALATGESHRTGPYGSPGQHPKASEHDDAGDDSDALTGHAVELLPAISFSCIRAARCIALRMRL